MTNIYTIRDDAAAYFLPIFLARTHSEAKRMFITSLGDSFPHRSDFKLFHIGEFDEDIGLLTPQEPTMVLAGLSIPANLSDTGSETPVPNSPTKSDIQATHEATL